MLDDLLIADGRVTRKCLSPEEILCSGRKCVTCPGLLCNGGIYPTDRLTCNKCNEAECSNPLNIKPSVCETVVANDQCVTTFSDGKY